MANSCWRQKKKLFIIVRKYTKRKRTKKNKTKKYTITFHNVLKNKNSPRDRSMKYRSLRFRLMTALSLGCSCLLKTFAWSNHQRLWVAHQTLWYATQETIWHRLPTIMMIWVEVWFVLFCENKNRFFFKKKPARWCKSADCSTSGSANKLLQ